MFIDSMSGAHSLTKADHDQQSGSPTPVNFLSSHTMEHLTNKYHWL